MGVALFLFYLFIITVKLARIWTTSYVHFPQATCSDGSLPLYYSSLSDDSKQWLLFLPGGAGCSNEESCVNRSLVDPGLTSSRVYSPSFPNAKGIFSDDCEKNPAFCKANIVFLVYCSSDWWSGNSTIKINSPDYRGDFHFRGHNILTGAIKQLLVETYLSSAESFIISGNSAGGLGALLQADYVRSLLDQGMREPLKQFKVITDSSIFLEGNPYRELPCTETFLCGLVTSFKSGIQLWQSIFDKDCAQRYSQEPWKCFFVEHLLPFVSTPKMVVTHKYDIWQWWSDGLTLNIQDSLTIPEEVAWMEQKGNKLENMLFQAFFFNQVDIVLMTSCIFHSVLQFEEQFLDFKVHGKTAAELAHDWIQDGKRSFLSEECKGMACNELCSEPDQMIPKHIANFPPRLQ